MGEKMLTAAELDGPSLFAMRLGSGVGTFGRDRLTGFGVPVFGGSILMGVTVC